MADEERDDEITNDTVEDQESESVDNNEDSPKHDRSQSDGKNRFASGPPRGGQGSGPSRGFGPRGSGSRGPPPQHFGGRGPPPRFRGPPGPPGMRGPPPLGMRGPPGMRGRGPPFGRPPFDPNFGPHHGMGPGPGNMGPGNMGPGPGNMGPGPGNMGPGNMGPGNMGPGNMGPGPGGMGPGMGGMGPGPGGMGPGPGGMGPGPGGMGPGPGGMGPGPGGMGPGPGGMGPGPGGMGPGPGGMGPGPGGMGPGPGGMGPGPGGIGPGPGGMGPGPGGMGPGPGGMGPGPGGMGPGPGGMGPGPGGMGPGPGGMGPNMGGMNSGPGGMGQGPGGPGSMSPGMPPHGMSPQNMRSPGMRPQMMPPTSMPPPNFNMPPPGFMSGPPPIVSGASGPTGGDSNSNQEVWVETKTPEGKSYYYNARTRESAWTKPENVKIISQNEVEALAASQGPNATTVAGGSAATTTTSGQGTQPGQAVAAGSSGGNEPSPAEQSQTGTQNTPFSSMPSVAGMPPGMSGGSMPPGFNPQLFQQMMQQAQAAAGSGGSKTTPGTPAAATAAPVAGEPTSGAQGAEGKSTESKDKPGKSDEAESSSTSPSSDANAGVAAQKPPQTQPPVKPPEVAEWSEHKNTDGRSYYHNTKTATSTWDKPQVLVDWEAKCSAASAVTENKTAEMNGDKGSDSEEEAMDADDKDEQKTEDSEEMKDEAAEEQKAVDKSRPVSSTPVPGTPWCVVWTGDGRMFFFNPSQRTSVWETPEELQGRADVERMLQQPQEEAAKDTDKKSTEDGEPDAKKKKMDDGRSSDDSEPKDSGTAASNSGPRMINIGKEAAKEAEQQAAQQRAVVPLDIRMKQFRDMLAEKEVSAFSTWEKELHKIVFDPRYLLLTSKERKQSFEHYIRERAEEERREKHRKMREKKDAFRALLDEAKIHGKSSFSEFGSKYGKDERFKAIDKMRERESIFSDYISDLRRKEKEDKLVQKEKLKVEYMQMLKEMKELSRDSRWTETKKKIDSDPRYKAIDSSSRREDWFRDYVRTLVDHKDSDEEYDRRDREKQERIAASIKKREEEVQQSLSSSLRERDKEREQHKKDEALQLFKALLADLVRNAESEWRDAKKQLRRDHRWDLADLLEREEKEKLFEEHVENLNKKNQEMFHKLLDETIEIELTTAWKDARKFIKEDPRFSKFSSSDRRRQREFMDYMHEKMVKAKADFRELLKETKLITYKSADMLEASDSHMNDIEKILQNDKRHLILDSVPEDRKKILIAYIDDLSRKGMPPPPTATEPSRRGTK